MRSENCINGDAPRAQTLHRIRSLGQLSPPPDEPLPPLPLHSPYRFPAQVKSIAHLEASNTRLFGAERRVATLNRSSTSRSYNRQENETDNGCSSNRNAMGIMSDWEKQRTHFKLTRNSKEIPSLDDLGQILEHQSRLHELGTTFSPEGEMLIYGNPTLEADLHQMLRLGSIYDEQWNRWFNGRKPQDEDSSLCADLRVQKGMLQNEGVQFDCHQRRLNYGTPNSKLIRLSDQYDVLRENWLETLQNIHPAFRPGFCGDQVPLTPANLGLRLSIDSKPEGKPIPRRRRRSSSPFAGVKEEEKPSLSSGPDPAHTEAVMEHISPLDTFRLLSNARSVTTVSDLNPVTPERPCGATPATTDSSPVLQDSVFSHQTNTASLPKAQVEVCNVSFKHGCNELGNGMSDWRGGHDGLLAAQHEDTTLIKKSRTLRLRRWLKRMFGTKKNRAL